MSRVIKLDGAKGNAISVYQRGALESIDPDMLDDSGQVDPAAVLNQAREEAEQLVREAYAEGMRRGLEAGEKKFEDKIQGAGELLQAAACALQTARAEYMDQMSPEITRLVAAVAAKVLKRELSTDAELIQRTVRAALERLCDQERVTLRVNPSDLAALKEHRVALLDEFEGIDHLEIVPTDEVGPGGCYAESQALFVDATLESQLQHIFDALGA